MDRFCHQYGVEPGTTDTPKFADYTGFNVAGDATCDGWTEGEEQVHCLGQACMFDYCIYQRHVQLQGCLAFAHDWETAVVANGGCRNYKDGSCILANRRFDLYGDGKFWDMLFAAKNEYNMRAPWR